jgi:hypothetical protein
MRVIADPSRSDFELGLADPLGSPIIALSEIDRYRQTAISSAFDFLTTSRLPITNPEPGQITSGLPRIHGLGFVVTSAFIGTDRGHLEFPDMIMTARDFLEATAVPTRSPGT